MGYYTGNGVITGGGESTNTLKTLYWYRAYAIRQRVTSQTIRRSGVSLAAAQAAHDTCNLTPVSGGSGDLGWVIYDAEGTRSTVSYSQVGDSNLYELNETTETIVASVASGTPRPIDA